MQPRTSHSTNKFKKSQERLPFVSFFRIQAWASAHLAGEAYWQQRELGLAAKWLRKAYDEVRELDDSDEHSDFAHGHAETAALLAKVYEFAGKASEATAIRSEIADRFANSLEALPDDKYLLTVIGSLQSARGEFDSSVEVFDRVIAIGESELKASPDDLEVVSWLGGSYHNRAQAYAGLKRNNEAIKGYLRAIELQEKAFKADPTVDQHRDFLRNHYCNIAVLCNGIDQYNRALEYADAGLRVVPGDLDVLLQKAFALIALERSSEAIPLLKRVLSFRKDPDVQELLDFAKEAARSSEQGTAARSRITPENDANSFEWALAADHVGLLHQAGP